MQACAVALLSMLALAAGFQRPIEACQGSRARVLAEFQARIEEDVLADDLGSIAAGVIVGSELVWSHAFGLRDREHELEAEVDTLYRIGSISKSITAATLMALVQRGVVALDDPVVKHLPEFARLGGGVQEARAITLRQLASHTGGLIREPELEGAASGPIAGWEEKILASIPATKPLGPPGKAYSYSNIGYGILGLAISRAAREPFPDLVRRLVFEPAGMSSATFVVAAPLDVRLAAGYGRDDAGAIDGATAAREHAGRGYKVPNGGVYSSVADLGRFMALMTGALGDEVLGAETRAAMLTRQTPEGGDAYGIGFSLGRDLKGGHFASHDGAVAGYTAAIVFHLEARTGVVLLRNYERGRTDLPRAAEQLLAAFVAAGA